MNSQHYGVYTSTPDHVTESPSKQYHVTEMTQVGISKRGEMDKRSSIALGVLFFLFRNLSTVYSFPLGLKRCLICVYLAYHNFVVVFRVGKRAQNKTNWVVEGKCAQKQTNWVNVAQNSSIKFPTYPKKMSWYVRQPFLGLFKQCNSNPYCC